MVKKDKFKELFEQAAELKVLARESRNESEELKKEAARILL